MDEALLFLDQRFLGGENGYLRADCGSGISGRLSGVIFMAVAMPIVAIAIIAIAIDVAVAVVVHVRLVVFEVIAVVPVVVGIVRTFGHRRRRRALQNHLGVKFVIIEHPTAFGVIAVAVGVILSWDFGGFRGTTVPVKFQGPGTIAVGQ